MNYINEEKLKERIMRRVYLISFVKKIFGMTAIKIYGSLVLLFGLYINVSIVDVFKNSIKFGSLGTTFGNLFNFYGQAFVRTELDVKVIFVLFLGLVSFILFDSVKKLPLWVLKKEHNY
ncbi:MAG: hypothetical protein AAB840_02070 [Patescibacteria group bacterium]